MARPVQVLVVARETEERDQLDRRLGNFGVQVFCCSTLLEAESFLSAQAADVMFSEVLLPDGDFRDVRAEADRFQASLPVVALGRIDDWDSYLADIASGAFDYMFLPASERTILRMLDAALNASSSALSVTSIAGRGEATEAKVPLAR